MAPTSHAADRASAIAAILQANIASGHYRPGDRLPSEADLCAHFQVSRPTLREALGRLAAVGLLVSRRGSGGGSFVARPDPGVIGARLAALVGLVAAEDGGAHSLTDARIQVEIGCAHLAALARPDIADLRAEIDQQSDFGLPSAAFAASCRRLHLSICVAGGNAALALMGQALVEAEFANPEAMVYETRERARFLSYHVRIANGIAGGRPEDCRAALLDLAAFEGERRGASASGPAEPERPPRMRDLRLPRVQRLTPEDGGA
jgi:DNA-binding FadR family transcriptional regulator